MDEFSFSDRALLARLAMGGMHERAGRYTDAEAVYRQVVVRAPDSPFAAQAVAGIKAARLAQDDVLGAKEQMDDIINAHADTEASAMAKYCNGEILLYEGRADDAQDIFDQVAREHHQTIAGGAASIRAAAALLSEARALSDKGNHEEAIRKCAEVISLVPGTYYALDARMFTGHNYLWLGKPADAIPWYQGLAEELGDLGDGPEAMYFLGVARHIAHDDKGAVDALSAALTMTDEDRFRVRAHWLLGTSYRNLGDYPQAMATLQTILDGDSPIFISFHPMAHFLRMQYASDHGDYDTAEQEAHALIESDPDGSLGLTATSFLSQIQKRRGAAQ